MNPRTLVLFSVFLLLLSCYPNTREIPRERVSLDLGWRFMSEDVPDAAKKEYDDSRWRKLNLPHDWSIEGAYDLNNPSGIAGAFLPTGTGWYRKHLPVDDLDPNDRYLLEFDGVYMNSDVWINGHHLGNRPYGYISFSYELGPYLVEGDNTIAVRVDHSKAPSGRWYTGSGIYRHVWLTRTGPIHVPQWGTRVRTPKVTEEIAEVELQVQIRNFTGNARTIRVVSTILDDAGNSVSTHRTRVDLTDSTLVDQSFTISSPKRWSPQSPEMYRIQTRLYSGGSLVDHYQTPLGLRSMEFSAEKGFLLNGHPVKLKGLSNHHDAGALGAAVPDDILYHRLKLLKQMGCNALRTTHNPYSPTFYDMCDTMGFMVMNEAFDGWWIPKAAYDYGNYFEEWWQKDLRDFILRDRNHPSVVMWSIGNEVRGFTAEQQKVLVDFVRQLDDTRPVTQGRGYSAPHIDIAGFNGHGEFKGVLEKFHKQHPDRPIIGTEITHTLQTRGVYRTSTWYRTRDNPAPWERPGQFKKMEERVYKIDDLAQEELFTGISPKYQSSYDNSIVRIGVRDDWNRVEALPYYMGNFRWTGFDYLGESFGWPARTANFGIIDLAGFPKDHYYLYQSLWSDVPMIHLLPHWTHPGKEGVEIPVVVYTNCTSAELFLNGRSLGEKLMGNERQLVWRIPYEPGEITAKAYKEGEELASKSFKTAGKASRVKLLPDRLEMKANSTDVAIIEVQIRDLEGAMVPEANHLVNFEIQGPAKLLGVENGDILDLSPHKVPRRKAFKGKCVLFIQSTGETGTIEVIASSSGLEAGEVTINVK